MITAPSTADEWPVCRVAPVKLLDGDVQRQRCRLQTPYEPRVGSRIWVQGERYVVSDIQTSDRTTAAANKLVARQIKG